MKLTYRPEIDGLRAIAVVGVILYHTRITIFGHQPFKGAFIGVDIFFVISGYLITYIILKELVTTGSFSFKHFYERRIRRMLPALLFVMLVSLPFAWMYLLPSSLMDFSNSILYSLGFSSNFYFWYTGQQYGAESGLLKPFLHTWSLSVEEQYYILFPISLLITFKYFRKYLGIILIIGFFTSLIIADWGSRTSPSFNFYVLPTRGWELLAGSILAYFEIQKGQRSKNQILNLVLPSVGLFLIGHSILFFNEKTFYPSFYTLSPIIGVSLVIWFSHKDELITKILSSKLFVGIGLISYSLYLWHYPILAFDRISEFTSGSIIKKFIPGVLIISLSIFTYFFIERPARNRKIKFKLVSSLLFISVLVLIIVNSIIIDKGGFKNRFPEILENDIKAKFLRSPKNFKKCGIENVRCIFNTSSEKKVYIVGDSNMGSLTFDLKDRVVDRDYQFITSTQAGCLYFPGFDRIAVKTNKIDNYCNNETFSKLEQVLTKEKNSIIIFGGRFSLYITNYFFDNKEGGKEGGEWDSTYISKSSFKTIQSSFKTSIDKLSKHNKIILIYPIPEVGWNLPQKFFNSLPEKIKKNNNYLKDYLVLKNYITTSYQVYKDRTRSSFKLLDSIKGKNIYRVYPHTLTCDTLLKDRCITHDDKNIFYSDYNHPSIKGAEMINNLIIKKIEKIEAKFN